jgi:hypothetical protein
LRLQRARSVDDLKSSDMKESLTPNVVVVV